MAIRAHICRVIYDTSDTVLRGGLGWSPDFAPTVKTLGGGWSVLCYWDAAPRQIGTTGFPAYNAIALVDVPDHSLIDGTVALPLTVTSKADLLAQLRTTPLSALPTNLRNTLRTAGFTTTTTTVTLDRILSRLLDRVWNGDTF